MENLAFEIRGLSKKYKNFTLSDINLQIPCGSIVGLIGQNGAGKSTLIKSVLGLVRKDSGEVSLPNLPDHGKENDIRLWVGYIPEILTFYEWMSVKRLVRFVSSYYPRWDPEYCRELLARYQLEENKLIKHLSKGMRAKLALLIALAHRPLLLILDEPTPGLDPIMKHNFLQELRHLTNTGETRGVLISSHILGEIEYIADRIAVLREGRLKLYGETSKILSQWKKLSFVSPSQVNSFLPQEWQVNLHSDGRRILIIEEGDVQRAVDLLRQHGIDSIDVLNPDLQEIFVKVA
jgi:ABC-2 type transport system ATP-binding protein